MTALDDELAKLRETLRLCQLELVEVRGREEEREERLAPLERQAEKFIELSENLDERLRRWETARTGLRGWVARQILGVVPSEKEVRDITLLRSSDLFDGAWYLREYPGAVKSGMSPALHYLRRGAVGGRDPGPHFDTARYLEKHPDVPRGMNPLIHHLETGTTLDHDITGLP